HTVLSSVPTGIGTHGTSLTGADLVALNTLGARAGFTGPFATAFGPGLASNFDPTGLGAGTGDFVGDLTSDAYLGYQTQGSSTITTTIKDSVTNSTPSGTLGESVYDTATVTTSPTAFTATGTVTYEFFT